MLARVIKQRPLRVAFQLGVFVITAIVSATTALAANSVGDQPASGQESVEQRISSLKTFLNDKNIPLFHNELMQTQRDADDPNIDTTKLAQFIVNIWEKNKTSLPDLNWQNATKDEFRVSVGAIITLGIRDGWINYEQEKINQYFREKATAEDTHVSSMAISHLGIGGDDKDAVLLKGLSSAESRSTSRIAIRALGMLCSPAGEEALVQLESEISDTDIRAWVAETINLYYGNAPVMRCYK